MSRRHPDPNQMEAFREDNPNPRFRPSVDRLVSKLRTLSTLEPLDVKEHVIVDLMYYLKNEPKALARIIGYASGLMMLSMKVDLSDLPAEAEVHPDYQNIERSEDG